MKENIPFLLLFVLAILAAPHYCDAQWAPRIGPGRGGGVASFAVLGPTLYAGTESGVLKSTDQGETWWPSSQGLPIALVECLAATHSEKLFAAVYGNGIFISVDGGASWAMVSDSIGVGSIFTSIVTSGATILVSSFEKGVMRSDDDGNSWRSANEGLPPDFADGSSVRCLGVSDQFFFAGVDNHGVYRMALADTTWHFCGSNASKVAVYSNCMFASSWDTVYRSTDQGNSWTLLPNLPGYAYGFVFLDSLVFVSVGGYQPGSEGIYRSSDRGNTWTNVSQTLTYRFTGPAMFSAFGSVFACGFGNIFKSADLGEYWWTKSISLSSVNALSYRAPWLYAGNSNGLFRSSNGGRQWQATSLMWTWLDVTCMTWLDSLLFVSSSDGVYRSSDGGNSWTDVNNGIGAVGLIASSRHRLFAGGGVNGRVSLGVGLFVSTDQGGSWTRDSTFGLKHFLGAVFAEDSLVLVYRIGGGVMRSTDEGTTWAQVGSGLPTTDIEKFARCGKYLFAGTAAGIYRSDDNGLTWVDVNGNGTGLRRITDILYFDSTVVLATNYSGIYWSHHFGDKGVWVYDYTGEWMTSLVATPTSLFGVAGGVVYERPWMDVTSIAQDQTVGLPITCALEQNYPNPFNPFTTIEYTIGGTGDWGLGTRKTRLAVYDVLGRQVATLVDEAKAPGSYQVTFDASGLASGVYLYRLQAGTYVETKKLVVLK